MSKSSDERATPSKLFDPLNREFHFTLDVCATEQNTKCPKYFTWETNGLYQSWANEICWMNPPYSNLRAWLEKARRESQEYNATVVCILPCDTSTRWFHDNLWDGELHKSKDGIELRFPQGRFKFGKYTTAPQFATIIAILS